MDRLACIGPLHDWQEVVADLRPHVKEGTRRLRDLLSEDLTAERRHAFLAPRVRGAEIDAFAREVATLSLILADYPNANGWRIEPEDLFRPAILAQEASGAKVVLCNPPWEDFDEAERAEYPDMAAKSFSKSMAVLRAVLDARPAGIGFVCPRASCASSNTPSSGSGSPTCTGASS